MYSRCYEFANHDLILMEYYSQVYSLITHLLIQVTTENVYEIYNINGH